MEHYAINHNNSIIGSFKANTDKSSKFQIFDDHILLRSNDGVAELSRDDLRMLNQYDANNFCWRQDYVAVTAYGKDRQLALVLLSRRSLEEKARMVLNEETYQGLSCNETGVFIFADGGLYKLSKDDLSRIAFHQFDAVTLGANERRHHKIVRLSENSILVSETIDYGKKAKLFLLSTTDLHEIAQFDAGELGVYISNYAEIYYKKNDTRSHAPVAAGW